MSNAFIPSFNPPVGPGANPVQAEIAPKDFKHNLIDTRKTSIADIITMIKGAPLTTVYFQQILGSDQQALNYQNLTLQVYQQYRKINNLVMAVQQDLSHSQDQTTSEFKMTGRSITYPRFVPNKFDHFLAPIRDGQMGLFTVTEVERKSIYAQATHEITYDLVQVINDDLYTIFNSRVVEELYFNLNLLRSNGEPYLNTEENIDYHKLRQEFTALSDRMTQLFYDNYPGTLMVPSQGFYTFDPFLIKAFQNVYNPTDKTSVVSMSHYRVESLSAHRSLTIWDLMFRRNRVLSDTIVTTLRLLPSSAFARLALYGSVYYSVINYVVFPDIPSVHGEASPQAGLMSGSLCGCSKPDETGELNNDPPIPPSSGLFVDFGNEGTTSTIAKLVPDPDDPDTPLSIPYLKPITEDTFYIFSETFYTALSGGSTSGCSVLELMVLDYLDRKPLVMADLKILCNDIRNWSPLQKFYFMPVLAILLQSFIGEM